MSFQYRDRLSSPPAQFRTPATALPPAPKLSLLTRATITWRVWQRRIEARRNLAMMDARSLTEIGILAADGRAAVKFHPDRGPPGPLMSAAGAARSKNLL
jgi:uncharacterized protein YjiS (DUF1127 family)